MGKAMLSSMKGVGSSWCQCVPPIFFTCISASGGVSSASRSSPSPKAAASQRVFGARLGTIFLGIWSICGQAELGDLCGFVGGSVPAASSVLTFQLELSPPWLEETVFKGFPDSSGHPVVPAGGGLSGFSPASLSSILPTPASSLSVLKLCKLSTSIRLRIS